MAVTPVELAVGLLLAIVAGLAAWLWRGKRCAREKAAVNSGWQTQLDARQSENGRLADRNNSLRNQLREMQAVLEGQQQRVRQLDAELRDALAGRDELQKEIRDIRGGLEQTVAGRDRSPDTPGDTAPDPDARMTELLASKNEKIARLKRELGRWQERVPPLVDRYRERDEQARTLQAALDEANDRLSRLQPEEDSNETRIEQMQQEPEQFPDASNDQYDDTQAFDSAAVSTAVAGGIRPDDLKRIRGIGPTIERTLNRLGIVSFRQLAELSEVDIDRVAAELRGFRTRIHREDWVGQALALQREHPDHGA